MRGRKTGEFVKALSQCSADRDAQKSLQKSLRLSPKINLLAMSEFVKHLEVIAGTW